MRCEFRAEFHAEFRADFSAQKNRHRNQQIGTDLDQNSADFLDSVPIFLFGVIRQKNRREIRREIRHEIWHEIRRDCSAPNNSAMRTGIRSTILAAPITISEG